MPERHSVEPNQGCMAGEQPWHLALEDGGRLAGYARRGSDGESPAGVFLHGFRSHCEGGKARYLSAAAGELGCDWLRFDQRGCGRSSGTFQRFTVSGAIDDTQRVLDAFDAPARILVGSSLGALVAVHVAQRGRHRIDGLVLIAPALRFTERFIHRQLDDRDLETWQRRGYRWFPDLYYGGCFRLDYAFCADTLRYGEPPDTLPCPVRVLHGTRDELLPVDDTEDWVARLKCPGRALEIIDGGDHRLTEWSDAIARHTQSLLEEVSQSCA